MALDGLDALMVILVVIFASLVIVWILRSMRYQFTTTQLVFLTLTCVLLGVFLESYFRNTRELVLSVVGLLVVMGGWVLLKLRGLTRRRIPAWILILGVGVLLLSSMAASVSAYQPEMHSDLVDSTFKVLSTDGKGQIVRVRKTS